MTRTVWLPWLLLLIAMDGTQSLTYNNFLKLQLTTACPYTKFCTVGPSQTISNRKYTSCCRDCSCEPNCYKYGTCCPDYQNVNTIKEAVIPCSRPIIGNSRAFASELYGLTFGINFYYIYKTCSPTFNNQSIITKCLHPTPNSLHENTIVSDGNGRVFQNYNCAQCNGVKTVNIWTVQILCDQYSYKVLESLPRFAELVSVEGCIVAFVPPDKATLKSVSTSQCLKIDHSTCNATGRWKVFDNNIKKACESSEHVFEYVQEPRNVVYKNVFCFLCNNYDSVSKFDVCLATDDDVYAERAGVTKHAFTALIHHLAFSEDSGQGHSSLHKGDTECSPTEIYDSHLDKCRQLHCPLTLTPLNGKCVDAYTEVNGLPIGFAISAPLPGMHYSITQFEEFKELAHSALTQVQKQLDIEATQCKQCGTTVSFDNNSSRIILEFAVQTATCCQASTVIDLLYRWKSKTQTMNISNRTIHLQMDFNCFTCDLQLYTFDFPLSLSIDGAIDCKRIGIHLKEHFYCPFVALSREEYDQLMSQHSRDIDEDSFTLIEPSTANPNDTVYQISVDKYLLPISNQGRSNQYANCVIVTFALFLVMSSIK